MRNKSILKKSSFSTIAMLLVFFVIVFLIAMQLSKMQIWREKLSLFPFAIYGLEFYILLFFEVAAILIALLNTQRIRLFATFATLIFFSLSLHQDYMWRYKRYDCSCKYVFEFLASYEQNIFILLPLSLLSITLIISSFYGNSHRTQLDQQSHWQESDPG